MADDATNFLHSLLRLVAGATGVRYTDLSGGKRELWLGPADAAAAAAVYTTALRYPGAAQGQNDAHDRISVQFRTRGVYAPAVGRAEAIYDALRDDAGRPLASVDVAGKTVAGADDGTWLLLGCYLLQRPGIVGAADGLSDVAFNADFSFVKR